MKFTSVGQLLRPTNRRIMCGLKSIAVTLLLLQSCRMACAIDDATTLAMLKSANAEHVASWSSGKMRFVSKADHPGHQCVDVSGELEWSKDYVYFRGERNETSELGLSAGVIKRSIQILRADGEVASLIYQSQKGHPSSDSMYLFPDDGSQHDDGVIRLMPDYQWFLFSLSPLEKHNFAETVRPDESAESEKVKRTIATNQNTVTILRSYKKRDGDRHMVFRLDAGGLCESMKNRQHVRDGMQFEHVTRKWRQSANGGWYPEKSEQVARMESESLHFRQRIHRLWQLMFSKTPRLTTMI